MFHKEKLVFPSETIVRIFTYTSPDIKGETARLTANTGLEEPTMTTTVFLFYIGRKPQCF